MIYSLPGQAYDAAIVIGCGEVDITAAELFIKRMLVCWLAFSAYSLLRSASHQLSDDCDDRTSLVSPIHSTSQVPCKCTVYKHISFICYTASVMTLLGRAIPRRVNFC